MNRNGPRLFSFSAIALVAVGAAGLTAIAAMIHPVNDDDTFHLQCIWLTAQGYVPYRDFFAGHPPGFWILAFPMAWLPSCPSQFLVLGRLLLSAAFGGTVWIAGRLTAARGWQAILLGVLAVGVMVDTQWFLFRVAYVEVFLVFVHLWLLNRAASSSRTVLFSLLAAVAMGLICSMSVRGVFFLPIQPLFLILILHRDRRRLGRALGGWVLGCLLAALPAAIYLTMHELWREAWTWIVVFPTTLNVLKSKFPADVRTVGLVVLGIAGLAALAADRRLPLSTRQLLTVAWIAGFVYYLLNPLRIKYNLVHIYMLSAMLAAVIPFVILDRLRIGQRAKRRLVAVGVLVLGVALVPIVSPRLAYYERMSRKREILRMQLDVLDWLNEVSDGEGVVCVDPYHPVLCPNATFLRGSWQYYEWLDNPLIQQRLHGFAEKVVQLKPPVIAAAPWRETVKGRDLIQRFQQCQVIDDKQAARLRELIATDYVEVVFPMLSPESEIIAGNSFWIRSDRLDACPIPQPYLLGRSP